MQGFAAVLAEVTLARAVSDTAGPAEKTAAQRLVADLLVSCPKTIDSVAFLPLAAFLSDPETDIVHASGVARAVLARSPASTVQRLLAAFLTRPDLTLSDIEPFVSSGTAHVLASESDRPDVLERVFADPKSGASNAVLAALAVNAATPQGVRLQATSRLLNLYDPDATLVHVREALRALREHPETQQPVFDTLNLPDMSLLRLFVTNTQSWTVLDAAQLDRLAAVFAQIVPADDQPLAWNDCSRELLLHPSMSADSSQRLVAAVDAVCTPSSVPAVHDWLSELSEAARILSAPNRVAALFECTAPPIRRHVQWRIAVLGSASAADIVAVLTDRDVRPARRQMLIRDIVRHARLEVCTPELLAALPVITFREWRARTNDAGIVDAVLAELLGSRLGTDTAAWRVFAELAEAADAEATVGDVAALAATLTGDQ